MKRKAGHVNAVNAVDVAKFREAARKFMGNCDSFAYVVIRLAALTDVMYAKRKQVFKRGTFPSKWIDTAATLPLIFSRGFDVAHFEVVEIKK
jgi:hypothetical protein